MKVTVAEIQNYFKYRIVSGDEEAFKRVVKESGINRPGFELMCNFKHVSTNRVILLGEREIKYIEQDMTEQEQRTAFEFLTADTIPMILIARDLVCPSILLEIATRKNFPILSSYAPTSNLMSELVSFLENRLAPMQIVHGTLMNIFGVGVLITGQSGMGKSEIALELIRRGQILVSDDRTDVKRAHNIIIGEAPELLRNMLEIRGIGIIDVTKMYGIAASMPSCRVNLVIELQPWNPEDEYARAGVEERLYDDFFGLKILHLNIPVKAGRSMAVVVEAAVNNFILMQRGIDCSKDFEMRVYDYIKSRKDEVE